MRQSYVFVTASKRGQTYRDYFDPNNTVQLRVMGMEGTVVRSLGPSQIPDRRGYYTERWKLTNFREQQTEA